MARESSRGRKKLSRGRGRSSSDLSTPEALEFLARSRNLEPPKKSKTISALRNVGRALNIGTAITSGAVKGAIDPNISIFKGIKEGVKTNSSFGDLLREGLKPESRIAKIALGTAGFAADVLFDPITYLTFGLGAGLKVGGKVLTKSSTKLFQQAATEASQVVGQKGAGVAQQLFEQAIGKKGLTKESLALFKKQGVSKETIEELQQRGSAIFDLGGAKFAGQTFVTGKTLGKTPILAPLGRTIKGSEAFQNVKKALGKAFVANFGQDSKIVDAIDTLKRLTQSAQSGIIKSNQILFKGLNDKQMRSLFDTVFKKKLEIISKSKDIEESAIKEINKAFPELKIKSSKDAKRVLDAIEETTQAEVVLIRKAVDDVVNPYFKAREAAIKSKKFLTTSKDVLQTGPPFVKGLKNVDDLNRVIDGLKATLKALRKKRGSASKSGKEELKDLGGPIANEGKIALNNLIKNEEERLAEVIDKLVKQVDNLKSKPARASILGKGKKGKTDAEKLKSLTPTETILAAERLILKLQNELADKSQQLGKILDSRRIAKARQKTERLVFDDPQLQVVSDKLFEGDNAIVKRFAKLAGIPEEEAIKFYIPSKFNKRVKPTTETIKRLGSANTDFKKKFTGVEEDLIRNPFEAFSRGQIDVVTARLKTDAFRSVAKSLGTASEKTAERLGYKKVTRTGINGKQEAWFPEEVAEQLNKFLDPARSPIDDLGKSLGFDWATGIFKGWVTAPFPGFHMRNLTSNQFLNMLKIGVDVMNPSLQAKATKIAFGKGLDDIVTTKTGKTFTLKQIQDGVNRESDILTAGPFSRREQFLPEGTTKIGRPGKLNLNPFSRENIALEKGRAFGTKIEAQAKLVSILSAVMEGKTIKQGIKQAEEALFNYSKITDFERTVMRRVIPFYTFARKNAELQVKAIAKTPGRVAAQLKAVRGAGQALGEPITEEDVQGLPGFVLEGLGIKSGANEYGQDLFLTGFGLPIEEFLQRFSGEKGFVWNSVQNTLAQTNPLIKFPLERATGQDFFRDRPITEISNAQDLQSMLDSMPKAAGDELKDFLDFKRIPSGKSVFVDGKRVKKVDKFTANPFRLHLIRNLPSSRILNTVGFLSDPEEAQINKAVRFFTGVRGWTIDQEEQEFFNDLKERRELEDWLIRMGVGAKFERFFVPKNSERGK